jgi:hypothetical protein
VDAPVAPGVPALLDPAGAAAVETSDAAAALALFA